MAGVNVILSANTQKYVSDIKKAQDQGNKSMDNIGKKAGAMGNEVTGAFNLPSNAISGFLTRLGPVAGAIGIIGGAAYGAGVKLAQMGAEVAKSQKQMEAMARQNGVSVEEMNKYGLAIQGVGMDMEKLGDISKDVLDRIGDNISTGGGALEDLWDTLKGKSEMTINDLKGLGGLDALKKIQQELDRVGASAAQQTFVLESLSSDASKLTPVLRMNEQQLNEMLNGYATKRASLAVSTMDDITRIQSNMDTLSNNFNAALTNSFGGLIKLADTMTKKISDALFDISESSKTQTVVSDYISSGGKIDAKNFNNVMANSAKIMEQMRIDAAATASMEFNPIFDAANFRKRRDELIAESEAKWRETSLKAADIRNAESINSENVGTVGNVKAINYGSSSDANKAAEANAKARTKLLVEIGKTETELQNSIGEESTKALQSRLSQQNELLKANGEERKGIVEAQGKFAQEAAQKRFAALATLNKTEEDNAKYAYQSQLNQLNKFLQDGSLTQSEFDQAKILAEQTLQNTLADIRKKARDKELEEERKLFNEQQAILQGKLGFAVIAQERADLELEIAVRGAENQMAVLNEKAGKEVITEQMKQDKISTLRQEHRDKEIERELMDVQSDEQREILKWEMKRQFVEEQHELGLLSEQAYQDRMVEIEANATKAKRDLMNVQLGTMSELFSGMAQNLKEGSKMQRAAFLMEKASTISRVTLGTFDALAAIDKDPSLPTFASKAVAKVTAIAQGASQVAGATAVTLGQFHSGSDLVPYANGEVSNTGSYILKGGERVVQPEANKDLTSYLESNKKGGGSTSIDASINITGNTIDESFEPKFKQMCFDQMETIYDAFNQHKANLGG